MPSSSHSVLYISRFKQPLPALNWGVGVRTEARRDSWILTWHAGKSEEKEVGLILSIKEYSIVR